MYKALYVAQTLNMSCKRYLSSIKLPSEIVVPLNKDMIVCWHPERTFPYECSLPLPKVQNSSSPSILCIGEKEIAETFKHKKPQEVVQELSKITYTTKHRWYPKRAKRALKIVDEERPYL